LLFFLDIKIDDVSAATGKQKYETQYTGLKNLFENL